MHVVKLAAPTQSRQAQSSSKPQMPVRPDPTRHRVITLLAQHGQLSAPELAQRLQLSVPAVRRHLEMLDQAGHLQCVESEPAQGGAARGRGRPPRSYQLTALGRASLGSGYEHLATDVLAFLSSVAGPEAVREFAAARALSMQQRYSLALEHSTDHQQVHSLAQLLSADGYYAHSERVNAAVDAADTGESEVVCQNHCPVSAAAQEFPQLCEQETAMFAQLLQRPVTRVATIAAGAPSCVAHIGAAEHNRHAQHDQRPQGLPTPI